MANLALYALFAASAVLAFATIARNLRRFGGQALALRQQLRECPGTVELRWTIREQVRQPRDATVLAGRFRAVAGRPAAMPALRAAA